MVKHIFAVKDELVGFTNVVLDYNTDIAIRSFASSVVHLLENDSVGLTLDDYSLYEIGTFNMLNGEIVAIEPKLITTASRCVREFKLDSLIHKEGDSID